MKRLDGGDIDAKYAEDRPVRHYRKAIPKVKAMTQAESAEVPSPEQTKTKIRMQLIDKHYPDKIRILEELLIELERDAKTI